MKVAIIGAGIAGSTCGRFIQRTGNETVLFDKARGAGGRLSTRRRDGVTYDFGAPVLSAQSSAFTRALATWIKAGAAQQWPGRFGYLRDGQLIEEHDAPARFVGTPGMNAIVKQLQVGLDVRYGQRVDELIEDGRGWRLVDVDGAPLGRFDAVVLAVPAPQAMALLSPHGILTDGLAQVRMDPCWTVMAHWSAPLDVSFDALELTGSIGWATRERSKPGRVEHDAWVIHASSAWSRENLELDAERVSSQILKDFAAMIGIHCPMPTAIHTHRWRYSRVRNPLGVGSLWDGRHRIGVCGDMCLGGRVENAYLSGRALAQTIGRGGFK
ncbi:MAG: FAD-dependent oxidoreductase [Myxococcota bacterium]|nr:FAD-dependent oxidoreductase [Myxococcota bacterium]